MTVISIHALHEESDARVSEALGLDVISIHALHEESDIRPWVDVLRGRISIHALHEESDSSSATGLPPMVAISIHALHEESDDSDGKVTIGGSIFQSTLSMRRATPVFAWTVLICWSFQSTLSMRRATSGKLPDILKNLLFQSTLSMRRATDIRHTTPLAITISIHALHEESDSSFTRRPMSCGRFQSTLSMRRATPFVR